LGDGSIVRILKERLGKRWDEVQKLTVEKLTETEDSVFGFVHGKEDTYCPTLFFRREDVLQLPRLSDPRNHVQAPRLAHAHPDEAVGGEKSFGGVL